MFLCACVSSLQTLHGGSQTCQVRGYAHQLVCADEPQAAEGGQHMSHAQSRTSGQSHKTCQKYPGHVSDFFINLKKERKKTIFVLALSFSKKPLLLVIFAQQVSHTENHYKGRNTQICDF